MELQPVNTAQNVMGIIGAISYDDAFYSTDEVHCDFGAKLGAADAKLKLTTLPQNAVILDAKLFVAEAFSAAPTKFQIGTAANPSAFGTFADKLTTQQVVDVVTGNLFALNSEDIYITLTVTKATQTKGRFFLYLTYMVPGRANEVIGNNVVA